MPSPIRHRLISLAQKVWLQRPAETESFRPKPTMIAAAIVIFVSAILLLLVAVAQMYEPITTYSRAFNQTRPPLWYE